MQYRLISNDYSLLTAVNGVGTISTANSNLDGTGATTTLFTAGGKGAIIKSIRIKATTPVVAGMIRFFVNNPAPMVAVLVKEIQIPI